MKIFVWTIAAVCLRVSAFAQPGNIKLYEIISTKTDGGGTNLKPGKELTSFAVPAGANTVRMYIQTTVTDFKKITVKNKLHLKVTTTDKGNELTIHDWYWPPLTKNMLLSTDCYFPAGEYTISICDNDDPASIFLKKTITVKPNAAKAANTTDGFAYDRMAFKIWTCTTVDDNWKAIGQTSSIKAGTCINLYFESKVKIKNLGTMRWGIYKVEADGKETYINQLDQGIGPLPEWRRLTYEECSAFATKGNYRIYICSKDDADAYYGVNNKNYFAKADLSVQ